MSTDWLSDNEKVEAGVFQNLAPEEVLIEYESPLAFTFRDEYETLLLAYAIEEVPSGTIFLVVPVDESEINNLKVGAISIRQALTQPIAWAVEASEKGVVDAWRVRWDKLPNDAIPSEDVLLWPSLRPFLSIKATGENIKEGCVPSLVIKQVLRGVEKSLKILNDEVSEASGHGRPKKTYRSRYQLNAQFVTVASFHIGFRRPEFDDEEDQEEFDKVTELFRSGLKWLASGATGDQEIPSPVYEAMKYLTPSSSDAADTYEIGGSVSSEGNIRVSTDMRKQINMRLREEPTEIVEIADLSGRIRELDLDLLTFTLRGSDDERKCAFSEEFLDEVWEAFDSEKQVRVIGTEGRRRFVEVDLIRQLSNPTGDE